MRPIEFGALMERFFIAATTILTAGGAAIDKMVGDKVIALYLPGLISDRHNYRRNAVRAGIELLRATGHAEAGGPWLPIGVGVHSGVAFVGSIGTERGTYEFAALGETMNLGARLVAAADTGEVVISSAIWPDVTGGNKYLRTLFIHGARAALPHLSERDTPLGRWVKGLLGRAHQNVVVVALANKLARIAWAVLRHGDAFEADKMPVLV